MVAVNIASDEKNLYQKYVQEDASLKHQMHVENKEMVQEEHTLGKNEAVEHHEVMKIEQQKTARIAELYGEKQHEAREKALDEQRLAHARKEAAIDALLKAHMEY